MARPLTKKNLTRPPGIERKIDIALPQDWAILSRRARETNPQSGDFLPSECLVHLLRDAIRRSDDRIARVLMPQLLKRAEANLKRTVPDSRMRDAESVRHEILSDLAMMFTQDGTEGHEDELDFYECRFGRALRFLRIDHVRKALATRKELTDLPRTATARMRRPSMTRCWRGCPGSRASVRRRKMPSICPRSSPPWIACPPTRSGRSCYAASSATKKKRRQKL